MRSNEKSNGADLIAEEALGQAPVERRVEDLTDADHDVTAVGRDDAQVVGDVELRLARLELHLAVARQRQLEKVQTKQQQQKDVSFCVSLGQSKGERKTKQKGLTLMKQISCVLTGNWLAPTALAGRSG